MRDVIYSLAYSGLLGENYFPPHFICYLTPHGNTITAQCARCTFLGAYVLSLSNGTTFNDLDPDRDLKVAIFFDIE